LEAWLYVLGVAIAQVPFSVTLLASSRGTLVTSIFFSCLNIQVEVENFTTNTGTPAFVSDPYKFSFLAENVQKIFSNADTLSEPELAFSVNFTTRKQVFLTLKGTTLFTSYLELTQIVH